MKETYRRIANIILSLAAIGVMVFYSFCVTSCSYLKGSIFGIDLQYVGIVAMAGLIFLNVVKADHINCLALAAGLGGELFLVAFQVKHGKYCPYCIAFGTILVVQFLINFEWRRKWYLLASAVAGLLFFVLFFKGSVLPVYDYGSLFRALRALS